MIAHTIPADALEDPEFRKQMQGLKDVSAALNGQQASSVVFSTDEASVLKRKMPKHAQVTVEARILVSTAGGPKTETTVGKFVSDNGLPNLDFDDPKCHFHTDTDVTLFKMQLAEQGLATVPGFEIKLAK